MNKRVELPFGLERAKLVRDADGAVCLDCSMAWDLYQSVPWSFRQSQWMHERGTGHRTVMVRRIE